MALPVISEIMFKIRANHSETFEVQASLDKVQDFFTDIKNFMDLMPSIESIHQDSKGIMHWKICADIPLVGSFTEKFAMVETERSEERIEWNPVQREKYNLMRYAADFLPKGSNKTLVQFTQFIELRRKSPKELHFLAGFAGENKISTEMSKRISSMLRTFIQKARERLEK